MLRQIPEWLQHAVIYNIYPQSFYDSNADGIGDLQGIIDKLDYIESLGVNCIWLNPIYVSPFRDAGYDVADFRQVAERYGTNEDAAKLFTLAHERGIRVILDFVAGHTSTEHPWFRESAKPQPNKFSDWYIWTDNVFSPVRAPGQYISGFSQRDGKYMTNFFYFQAALNYGWANPQEDWQLPVNHPDVLALKAEMRDVMRHWLDMGADGFRVDMAASLVKDDPDKKATIEYWRSVSQWFGAEFPDAALVSEWSVPKQALNAGFHVDFMIHSGTGVYTTLFRNEKGRNVFPGDGNSFFDRRGKGDIREFLDVYLEHLAETRDKGFISIPTGNHDIPRLNNGRTPAELKIAFAFIFTMPGVPTLYYGDEIGMRNINGLTSKEGGYGRTGARTPMQWDDSENAGFSAASAEKLYLPLDSDDTRPTVKTQDNDDNSLLNLTRRLIKLRLKYPVLAAEGRFTPLYAEAYEYPFVYLRSNSDSSLIVALNPAERECDCNIKPDSIPSGSLELLESLGDVRYSPHSGKISMTPLSFAIWEVRTQKG